jgi:hypothetical protein
MSQNVHDRIKHLIEGTHEAFENYGNMNTDFAGFASMALSEFKSALQNPELTGHELRRLIRQGQTSHRSEDPQSCWATFMAQYVSKNANSDRFTSLKDATIYTLGDVYKEKR